MHINTDFRRKIAARNCGFRSIASVGAQIYGFVSSDAHAASGRKQLFAACLRRDRPVGGRNRKSSGSMKSSVQSKKSAIVPGCASFTVLSKYRRRAVSTYALGDFRQKCLKSSSRRGLIFLCPKRSILMKNVIAWNNVCLTSNSIRQTSVI